MTYYSGTVEQAIGAIRHLFLADSILLPAIAGQPTAAEVQLWAQANGVINRTIWYNATDDDSFGPTGATHVFRVDDIGEALDMDVAEVGSTIVTEELAVTAQNTIADLTQTPDGVVDFFVNGALVDGITNTGVSVSVDTAALGYNVGVVDVIRARYAVN